MLEVSQSKRAPLALGVTIVAGTTVGAGMFSLPIVASGMWYSWALLLLLITWFCMYNSALMILEANLNFSPGSSFNTFVGDILGPRWNAFNGLTFGFVLYILTYAYISGGGSVITATLNLGDNSTMSPMLASGLFALILALIVSFSTGLVGRICTLLIAAMLIAFLLAARDLSDGVQPSLLLNNDKSYTPFIFAAVPYFLTSFGFHGNVPSLMKYYGRDPKTIRQCLLIGSLLALAVYGFWISLNFGVLPRPVFAGISAAGGNIGDLLQALHSVVGAASTQRYLNVFANMAVVSSFLGVGLGLFDYIADLCGFDDSPMGRLKTGLLTFLPPTLGGLLFPDGFLYAIGVAGLCAAVWGTLVPALAVKVSREKYGNPRYRVWGGNVMIYVIMTYGLVLILCFLLASVGLLPIL